MPTNGDATRDEAVQELAQRLKDATTAMADGQVKAIDRLIADLESAKTMIRSKEAATHAAIDGQLAHIVEIDTMTTAYGKKALEIADSVEAPA